MKDKKKNQKSKDLTLVIPAKNEFESLPSVLSELKKYNLKTKVVLEKSDIETIKSIKRFDCQIIYQSGKGYGNALIEGIKSTKTKYFCIFNADGSFLPKELNAMKKKIINNNYDFVFGSRYEKNASSEDDTFITRIGNFFFTSLSRILFSLKLTDILYTYVMGKTTSFKKLKMSQADFRFCVELPIKAKLLKMKMTNNKAYERSRIAGIKKVNEVKDGFLILKYILSAFLK